MKNYGTGYAMLARDWGKIEKCPHCPKTEIQRTHKGQITCGGLTCKDKQRKKTRRNALEREKLREAGAKAPAALFRHSPAGH
jgi:hypothetical protein